MVALNGMRISGDLVSVENQQVTLKSPEIRELLIVSMNELQSVIALKTKQDPAELPQRQGRLEFTGGSLHGCLIDAQEGESSCLVWQPQSSATSSPLHRGVSGRIVYREAVPVATNPTGIQRVQARVRVQRAGGVIGQIQGAMETGKTNRKSKILTLHLKTGDTLPCSAASIDEQGVRFESANSDATFVPHSQIKVLELLSDASPVQIPPEKKERLLTLPRMQRDNPPTHLIRSVDGDYLRGRLLSMDDEQIKIELRLEEKIVRRDRVARIIWLHPELQVANKKPLEEASDLSRQIQAVPSNGHRLTFVPEQLAGSILSGKSDLLGICRVDLLQTDVVMIGASIELAAAELAFHQWKLKSAADPLATPSGGEATGDGGEGQESALVGKQAPEIELNLVEGGRFKLSEHKQKIVILDFWASWCGPCLQVMPQIDRVVHEFAEQGVELIAINLEETPEQVKAALARLSLSTTVALDRDGRVAERYGATSIPQTVIIDREGKVARLFVGGGARFDEQLRTALKTVIGATPQPVE